MISFTLPIEPTAQARPRVAVRGKFAHGYKSESQKANERALDTVLSWHAPKEPLAGALVLDFVAMLPIPASAGKKRRQAIRAGWEAPTKKPDVDNLAKQLMDAMTRLRFWTDDAQIVSLHCDKVYAETPGWSVSVYEAVKRL